MAQPTAGIRPPPPPPTLPDLTRYPQVPGGTGAKFRAADAVIAEPELAGPLRDIIDAVTPLRQPPSRPAGPSAPVSESARRTPPLPSAALSRPDERPRTPDTDPAIMSKALQAVMKPRLSSAPQVHSLIQLPQSREVSVPVTRKHNRVKSTSTLVQKLINESRVGSSAAAMDTFHSSTVGMNANQRRAYILKRRADEARVQQLRGIFAGYDANRDGQITKMELTSAVLSLGFDPTPQLLSKYESNSPTMQTDLATFIRVTMTKLEDAATTEPSIEALFSEFDKDNTGRIPLSTLLHVLCEVDSPSALSVDEVNEMLKMTGIMSELQSRDPTAIYATEVDYRALTRHMIFPMAKRSKEGGTTSPS